VKAVRVHAWGEAPRVEDVPEPQAPPGFSVVRMAAATVGHIDRTVWGGQFMVHPSLPYVPGVEAAGTVVSSARFAAGQRVWLRGAGLGTRRDGTWRELIVAPDEALGELPEGVPMALGSAFFSPCTSAWVALHEVGRLRSGETVVITGVTGAVGSVALQLAREAGARVLTLADETQQSRLPEGVEVLSQSDFAKPSAHLLVDTVGGSVLPLALRAVAPGGRAVLVGYTAGTSVTLDLPELMQRDVSLLPLNMLRREAAGRAVVDDLLSRLADGRLRLDVTTFALDEAASALEWIAQRGHRGRAVLLPLPLVGEGRG
jgi:NADPH2:quinone reductase